MKELKEAKSKPGRSMISRTGQHCYVKNRLLSKENEALSLQEKDNPNALSQVRKIKKNTPKARLTIPHPEGEDVVFFSKKFGETLSPEAAEIMAKAEAIQSSTMDQGSWHNPKFIRETRTQQLRRSYRLSNGKLGRKAEPMAKAAGKSSSQSEKMKEPYRYKLYSALKGCEFEAKAKIAGKQEKKKPSPVATARPRVATWLLSPSASNNAFDNAVYPISPQKSLAYTFSKLPRTSILVSPVGPNEKRFEFNPRETSPDPHSLTHYRSSPVIDFAAKPARDSKTFQATLTPASTIPKTESLDASLRKGGIPFSKMLPRELESRKPPQVRIQTSANINKVLDKLSTQKRVITPSFDLFKSRYRKDQQLPSFMENVNNRLAITGLSFEMLKANGYSDVEVNAPLYTSFGTKKSFRVENRGTTAAGTSEYKAYSPERLERRPLATPSSTSKFSYFA